MKILDFIKSLLPRLDKSTILEDIRITKTELEKNVYPSYESAAVHFKTNKLTSDISAGLGNVFYRNYDLSKSGKQPNFISEVATRIKAVSENLLLVEEQFEDLVEQDIINTGLTARKAVLIRAADHISFLSNYAIDLLNYVYILESISHGGNSDTLALPPAIVAKINANLSMFAKLLSIYGEDPKTFKERIGSMPDVVVNDKTASALAAVYREDKLDPFSTGLVSNFEGSPIYHIRLMIAQRQMTRYKANKDKKRMLELRLLNLKALLEQKSNPQLEHEIEYIQSRIEKLEYELAKEEDR